MMFRGFIPLVKKTETDLSSFNRELPNIDGYHLYFNNNRMNDECKREKKTI